MSTFEFLGQAGLAWLEFLGLVGLICVFVLAIANLCTLWRNRR